MKCANVHAASAKIELALERLQMTIADVDPRWTDAARRDFEKTYLEPIEPNVKAMLDAISHLATVMSGAEHDCSDRESVE